MEVKQEKSEDFKIETDERFLPIETANDIWNNEKDKNCVLKNEEISIKLEHVDNAGTAYFQPTSSNVESENHIIYGTQINSNLNKNKQSKIEASAQWTHPNYSVLSGGILICKLCGNLYARKFEFFLHVARHLVKKPHLPAHHSSDFPMKRNIKNELEYHQPKEGINLYLIKSQIQRKLCDSKLFSANRVSADSDRSKCEFCIKSFKNQKNLNKHILSHTVEKLFKCEICGESFRLKSTLNKHTRCHTVKRLFKCTRCIKIFKDESDLVEHISRIHDKKFFKCGICFGVYTSKKGLVLHLRTHPGEKPLKCDICLESFLNCVCDVTPAKNHSNAKFV